MEILTGEDQTKSIMLNVPFVLDQKGVPQMAQPGMPNAKQYDLRKGVYGVSVNIGKSWESRLKEGADEIGNAIQALPEQAALAILPLYFRFRDFPGATEMADVLQKLRDQLMPGLADEEEQQSTIYGREAEEREKERKSQERIRKAALRYGRPDPFSQPLVYQAETKRERQGKSDWRLLTQEEQYEAVHVLNVRQLMSKFPISKATAYEWKKKVVCLV